MSKIYLVSRDITKSDVTYDVYNHHVIIAKSPTEAKELALDVAADEGEISWVEANYLIFSAFIIGLWELGKLASKKIWRWNEE